MHLRESIYSFTLITFILSKGNAEYKFNVEWVKSVSYLSSFDDQDEEGSPNKLNALSPEEQWILCRNIVKSVPLDKIEPGRILFGVELHEVIYLDGNIDTIKALRCPTEPLSFVTWESEGYELRIIIIDEFLSPYEFEVQSVKYISVFQDTPEKVIRENYLYHLTRDEKWRLCNGAKMYASVTGMEPNSILHEVTGYEITHLDKSVEVFIALLCSTSPPLYLRPGIVNGDLKIMSEIEFLEEHYEFNTETVESVVKCESEDYDLRRKIQKNHLATLSSIQRWNLCVAAWTRSQPLLFKIRRTKRLLKPVGFYKISFPDGKKIEDVAFSCSTSREDVMFLRSGGSENRFIVMLSSDPNAAPWVWD